MKEYLAVHPIEWFFENAYQDPDGMFWEDMEAYSRYRRNSKEPYSLYFSQKEIEHYSNNPLDITDPGVNGYISRLYWAGTIVTKEENPEYFL